MAILRSCVFIAALLCVFIAKSVLADVSGPSSSSTGSFTLTYTAESGTDAELRAYKDGVKIGTYSVSPSGGSKAFSLGSGSYRFDHFAGRECLQEGANGFCYEPGFMTKRGSHSITVSLAVPGAISLATTSTSGSFAVSWGAASTSPNRYELWQRKDSGSWSSVYSGTSRSKSLSGLSTGKYEYRARACFSACSAYTSIKSITVIRTPGSISVPSSSTNGSVATSWSSVSGAASYILQEQKDSGSWSQVYAETGTSKTVSGRSNGVYRYRVAAVENGITGGYRYSSYVTVSRAPGVPAGLTVPSSSSIGSYTVSWNSVSGAEHYTLEQSGDAGGTWSPSGTSKSFSKSSDGTFSYRVRACSVYNSVTSCGDWTSKETVNVSLPSLSGPSSNSTGAFTLSYNTTPGPEAKLKIYKNGSYQGDYTISASSGTKSITGQGNGTYRYEHWYGRECLQYNGTYCTEPGWWKKKGEHTVTVSIPAPGAISLGSTNTSGSYTVSWGAASESPSSYILQERKDGGSWSTVHSASGTSKSLSGRKAGVYDYRVQACYSGCGSYTSSKTVTVARTPSTIAVPASSTNGSVAISWTALGGADSYKLQEQKDGGSWSDIYNNSGTSFTPTSRGTGTYRYRVAEVEGTLVSGYRYSGDVIVSRAPGVPANFSVPASDANGIYSVSWDAVNGAESYRLEETGSSTGNWSPTGISKSFTKTKNGSYSYRVRACSVYSGVESCGSWTSKKTLQLSLAELFVQSVSKTGVVTLAFNTDWSGAERCELKRGSSVVATTLFDAGQTFTETLSTSGTYSYTYTCERCLQGDFPSCYEPDPVGFASASATVVIAPGAVSLGINSSKSYDGSVTLTSNSSGPIDTVRWQKRSKGGTWPADTSYSVANSSEFTVSGLADGDWEFRTKNCNSSGCSSAWSSLVAVDVWNQPLPSSPALQPIQDSDSGTVQLFWADLSAQDVYKYEVYKDGQRLKTVETNSQSPQPVTGTEVTLVDGVYDFHLVACNLRDCSGTGNSEQVIVAKKPGQPSGVSLSPLFSRTGAIDLAWGSATGAIVRYELVPGTATSSGGPVSWNESGAISHTNLDDLVDNFALDEGFYAYKVRACNQVSSFSSCSDEVESGIAEVVLSSSLVDVEMAPHQEAAPAASGASVLASDRVGVVAGEFRVSESGAATYTLPIVTGPSSGGSTPSVSVSYSSSGGSGPLGVGWSIGGLSTISGCRKTFEEDGVNGSAFDRFCLDGQRLKLSSSGNYGDIGTEYRTTLDSFVRVRVVSSPVGSNKGFEVYRKDGSISYYGMTEDAHRANTWYLNEQVDSTGNRIEYQYLKDAAIGEHLIEAVHYSGNGADVLANTIRFNYDTSRPDKIYGYSFGEDFAATRRLTSIVSKADGVELRTYKFGYETSGTSRLRLAEVEECVGTNCRPATTFSYAPYDGAGLVAGLANSGIFHSGYEGGKYGDVDGDGRTDLVFIRYDGSTGKRYLRIALGSASGALLIQPGEMRIRSNERKEWHLIDYNDDGMDDLLHVPVDGNSGFWEVNYSDGKSFSIVDTPTTLAYEPDQRGQMYDFNADGLPDYLKILAGSGMSSGSGTPQAKIREMQRTGSGGLTFKSAETTRTLNVPIPNPPGNSVGLYFRTTTVDVRDSDTVADFNGDGIADMTAIATTRWTCSEVSIDCYNGITSETTNEFVVLLSSSATSHSHAFSRTVFGNIDDVEQRVADLNGDGLPDMLFRSSNSANWSVYHFDGDSFVSAGILPSEVDDKIQLMDWDGDGLVDILYPNANDKAASDYYRLYVLPNNSSGFGTGFDSGQVLGINKNDHIHYPMDTSGDGIPELVEVCANRDEQENHCDDLYTNNDKYVRVLSPKHSAKPVDQLIAVTNGFGVSTRIEYARLNDTSADVYTREYGSSALDYGNGSPVFDLYSPMYVVKRVISDAPAANDDTNTVEAQYHYAGARIQSGGRGFLGFESVTTYDPQNQVKTTTHYRQDYPFTGMPVETAKVIELSAANISTPAACSGTNLTLIGCSENQLATIEPVSGKTVMPYISKAIDQSYEIDGSYLGKVETQTIYNSGKDTTYGNVSEVIVSNFNSSNALVQRKTTSNDYNNVVDSSRWHLARLANSTVLSERFGALASTDITRSADFAYDPATGLLTDEWVEKGTPLALHTHYDHDRFGNRTTTTVTDAQGNSRASEVFYDAYGRYPVRQVNALQHTAEERRDFNAFGQPRRVLDVTGFGKTLAHSQFGEQYFEHADTGAHSTTLKALCADTGGCPTVAGVAAYFKVTTTGIDQTRSVVYHDRLGREIRKQTQDFHGAPVYVDTQYDEQSRVKKVSEPYAAGTSPRWTEYTYDLLGRTTLVDVPAGQCDVSTTYAGLTETLSSCGQTKVTEKNVLGEVAEVTDNIGGKLKYQYYADGKLRHVRVLDSTGVESALTTVTYDALGRKTSLNDPDKGNWQYGYNGFGELAWQKDAKGQGTAMTYDALGRMVTRADYTGFVPASQSGTLQNFSRWYYDQDPGCDSQYRFDGRLVAVAQAPVVISGGCSPNTGDFSYLKLLQYDKFGRLGETTAVLGVLDGDGDFYEKVTYDQYSRAHRTFDASNQQVGQLQPYQYGVETAYNAYGYKTGVRDVQAPADEGFYYTVQRMNLRGQVEEVELGNGLTTTYVYDPQSHRLTDILTDIVPGIGQVQNLRYDWYEIGNLMSKTDLSGEGADQKDLQESYQYDGLNRLRYAYLYNAGSQTAVQEVRYDDGGNITHKSDVGDYAYDGPQPHAVTSAGSVTYSYDANGNMIGDTGGRVLGYTVFDKPNLIEKDGHITQFSYGPDRSRYKRVDDDGSGTVTTLQVGSVEKVIERGSAGQFIKGYYRRTLAGVAVERLELDATDVVTGQSIQYLHKDLQGSLDVITDGSGQVAEDADGNKQVFSFDPWGQRRERLDWAPITGGPAGIIAALNVGTFAHLSTNRGYTGHEMLDEVGLIHMNGRVYDPHLARFVSADPVIDGVTSVQGYNRYAYVHNNPLIYTDPSGYSSWNKFRDVFLTGRTQQQYLAQRPGLNAAVKIAQCFFSGPACPATMAMMNSHQTYHVTGSIGRAIGNGAMAYVSAAAFQQIGNSWQAAANAEVVGTSTVAVEGMWRMGENLWLSTGNAATMIFQHAMVGGLSAKLQGGKFAHGFVSAGISKAATPVALGVGDAGLVVEMVVGGTASVASGGKFANGAVTAAFAYLLNARGSRNSQQRSQPDFNEFDDKEWVLLSDKKLEAKAHFGPIDILALDSNGELNFLTSDLFPSLEKSPTVNLGPVSFGLNKEQLNVGLGWSSPIGSVTASANVASPKVDAALGNLYMSTTPQIYKDGSVGVWLQDLFRDDYGQ